MRYVLSMLVRDPAVTALAVTDDMTKN